MLDKLKTALVLVVIAGLSGLLIYFVNEMTYQDIIDNAIAREENYYKEIFGLDKDIELDPIKEEVSGTVNQIVTVQDTDGTVYGTIYRGEDQNTYGKVTVLVGVNEDGTIAQVVISKTGNTPTYVKLLTKSKDDVPSYMDRFSGQDIDNMTYDTDAGASYTYASVVKIVEAAIESRGDTNE